MAVLSQATGLKKASLYHHFPGGKNEMLETAVLATIVELERRVFRFLDTHDDAAERVTQVLDGFETYTNGGRRSCLLAVIAQSSVADNFRSRIGAQFSAWTSRLSTTLVEYGHDPKRADTLALETLETLYGSLVVGRLLGTFEIFALGLELGGLCVVVHCPATPGHKGALELPLIASRKRRLPVLPAIRQPRQVIEQMPQTVGPELHGHRHAYTFSFNTPMNGRLR